MKIRFILFLVPFFLLSCQENVKVSKIQIATAANMQFAMDSIAEIFQAKFEIECAISSNSSGMLTAQIQNGAPYDVFVSANMAYPEKLVAGGLADEPIIYALGRLAFVYSKEKNFSSIDEGLNSPSIHRIALADKKTAPYGIAATSYLDSIHFIKDDTKEIIFGESISQVNQYLMSNSVDAAFTSMSFARKYKDKYNFIEVEQRYFKNIEQGACILKRGRLNHLKESELFISFLTSPECIEILKHFGYLVE